MFVGGWDNCLSLILMCFGLVCVCKGGVWFTFGLCVGVHYVVLDLEFVGF